MNRKFENYSLEKIDKKEFGNLELEILIEKLKEKDAVIIGILPLENKPEFIDFIMKKLKLDLKWDIIFPEGLSETIVYENGNMSFGEYKYIVVLKEKDREDNEYFYSYSAYKNLENLSKELKLLED